MKHYKLVYALCLLPLFASCKSGNDVSVTKSGLNPDNFKSVVNGDSTALYTLMNRNGMEACITNYGGRLVSLMVPDKDGNMRDVVLGFDSVQAYYPENNLTDFGSTVGRYANRINQGRFVLDGDTVKLPQNNFGHCLHGGGEMGDLGWQYRVYNAEQPNDSTLILRMDSPDGDNGFPGNIKVAATYVLRNDNSLDISYSATTDKPTVYNPTNHAYFNLTGDPTKSIADHSLRVSSTYYTPIDSTFMTTGEMADVSGTPFDFRESSRIGNHISHMDNKQIAYAKGIDHNFVLDNEGDISRPVAELYSPESGIMVTVYTTEPGIQVYTGNFLDGTVIGKSGVVYNSNAGICLETQHYPDSPNKPEWPSTRLDPGQQFNSRTIYKFTSH